MHCLCVHKLWYRAAAAPHHTSEHRVGILTCVNHSDPLTCEFRGATTSCGGSKLLSGAKVLPAARLGRACAFSINMLVLLLLLLKQLLPLLLHQYVRPGVHNHTHLSKKQPVEARPELSA